MYPASLFLTLYDANFHTITETFFVCHLTTKKKSLKYDSKYQSRNVKNVNDVGPGTLFLGILKILLYCVVLCSISGEKS